MASAGTVGRRAFLYWSSASSKATTSQTKIAELQDFTFTADRDLIDVTSHDSSGWKESLPGTFKGSWTAKVVYLSTGAAQGAMRKVFLGALPAMSAISILATSFTSKHKYTGLTRLSGFTMTAATDNAVLGDLKGEISGALTRTS